MIKTVKTFKGFFEQNINLQKNTDYSIEINEEFASIYDCKKRRIVEYVCT